MCYTDSNIMRKVWVFMKKALIIGAGPAGLTAACELLTKSKDIEVIVFEESDCFGGISKTVNYKGNRMDMGGHRFFSKSEKVNEIWQELMPIQAKPSYDDIKTSTEKALAETGPDPEKDEKVFLLRNRVSRIYYGRKFFDYPVKMNVNTIKNMGFFTTIIS